MDLLFRYVTGKYRTNCRWRQIDQLVDLVDQVGMDDLVGMKGLMDSLICASLQSTRTRALCLWCIVTKEEVKIYRGKYSQGMN